MELIKYCPALVLRGVGALDGAADHHGVALLNVSLLHTEAAAEQKHVSTRSRRGGIERG